ncbi:RNA-directed DNA polymerase (Reverse transcriptase), partial [Trifolium medium]|nr:RNA-directed DNA polymerase (Reverse transcriptase) [Trifolium medium]
MGTGRYLGMPSMIGRNKKALFSYLKERMWKRIQGWSGKHLSKA